MSRCALVLRESTPSINLQHCHKLTPAVAPPTAQMCHMCPSVPQAEVALHNPHQHILIQPRPSRFPLVRWKPSREDKESRYALWLETFYPTNPKATSTSQRVLATILQRPTPPAQRKVHTHLQGARVLTSEQCIQQQEEKEARKKEKQDEKERRKAEHDHKRQEKAEAAKVKKAAKKKGTAQSSKTASSA